ncbi:MAG: hypothetical protein ACRDIC_06100 [bacterium]
MGWTAPRTWTDGELVTKAIMDPHVRDNLLAVGPHLVVRKPSDESVTSSTVLQDDNNLLMALAANEIWHVRFILLMFDNSASVADGKVAFTIPAGASMGLTVIYDKPGSAGAQMSRFNTSGTSVQVDLTNVLSAIEVFGVVTNGGTAGNLTLQWAQAVSNASSLDMKANSTLWAVKLA